VEQRGQCLILLPDTGYHRRICHNDIIGQPNVLEQLFWTTA
jgi:hypothetical protein